MGLLPWSYGDYHGDCQLSKDHGPGTFYTISPWGQESYVVWDGMFWVDAQETFADEIINEWMSQRT